MFCVAMKINFIQVTWPFLYLVSHEQPDVIFCSAIKSEKCYVIWCGFLIINIIHFCPKLHEMFWWTNSLECGGHQRPSGRASDRALLCYSLLQHNSRSCLVAGIRATCRRLGVGYGWYPGWWGPYFTPLLDKKQRNDVWYWSPLGSQVHCLLSWRIWLLVSCGIACMHRDWCRMWCHAESSSLGSTYTFRSI